MEEGRNPKKILTEVAPNLFILPASSGVPEMAGLRPQEQAFLTSVLDEIIDDFDLIIIDTAAGIGDSVLWFNRWATENIIILTPDPTALTDAYALIKVMAGRYAKKEFQLVVNNVKSKKEAQETAASLTMVMAHFLQLRPHFLGHIWQDSTVVKAIRHQRPFFLTAPQCRAARAISAIAQRLLNQSG